MTSTEQSKKKKMSDSDVFYIVRYEFRTRFILILFLLLNDEIFNEKATNR